MPCAGSRTRKASEDAGSLWVVQPPKMPHIRPSCAGSCVRSEMYSDAPQPHCASKAIRSGRDSSPRAKATTSGASEPSRTKARVAAELKASGGSSGSPSERRTTARERGAAEDAGGRARNCSPATRSAGTRRVPPFADIASTHARKVCRASTAPAPAPRSSTQSHRSFGSQLKPRRQRRSPSFACATTSCKHSFKTGRMLHIEPERSTTRSRSRHIGAALAPVGSAVVELTVGHASAANQRSSKVSRVKASKPVRHRAAPLAAILCHGKFAAASPQSTSLCRKQGSSFASSSRSLALASTVLLSRAARSSARACLYKISGNAKREKSSYRIRLWISLKKPCRSDSVASSMASSCS
mmetsp:Transcript_95458/g.269922  ORF Transcript_95458/g.269922 Transcript_95458/m.269922 type:complete len:355 (+) Transcript_95458:2058-3122(+)